MKQPRKSCPAEHFMLSMLMVCACATTSETGQQTCEAGRGEACSKTVASSCDGENGNSCETTGASLVQKRIFAQKFKGFDEEEADIVNEMDDPQQEVEYHLEQSEESKVQDGDSEIHQSEEVDKNDTILLQSNKTKDMFADEFKAMAHPTNDTIYSTDDNSSAANEAWQIIHRVDMCMQDRIDKTDNHETLELLQRIKTAEIIKQLRKAGHNASEFDPQFDNDEVILDAVYEAGAEAAQQIIADDYEQLLSEAVHKNSSAEALRRFVKFINNIGKVCGLTNKSDQNLIRDEGDLLTKEISAEESAMIAAIGDRLESECTVEAIKTDIFVGTMGLSDNVSSCSELFSSVLQKKVDKETQKLEYYAKSVAVLHDTNNSLGKHFMDHIQKGSQDFEEKLHTAALASGSANRVRAQLNNIDSQLYEHIQGEKKEHYCERSQALLKRDPKHWISRSKAIQAYNKCFCEENHPALYCDANHKNELTKLRDPLLEDIRNLDEQRAKKEEQVSLPEAVSSDAGNYSLQGHVGIGPCQDPYTFKPALVDCAFCVNGNCVNPTNPSDTKAVNVFEVLQPLFARPAACVQGSCTVCQGLKPADPIQFKLEIGAAVSSCDNLGNIMASFKLFAAIKVCIGGQLGDIAGKLGWDLCENLGELGYYPFLQKIQADLYLPVPLPFPIGVRAHLHAGVRFGDLAGAVYSYCGGRGGQEYNCLLQMLNAQGKTGVRISLDVLLGVRIPFVGEIGKWVQTIKFETWEDRDAKEIAKNKANVYIATIGNSNSNTLCGKTWYPLNCNSRAGDKGWRANVHNANDRFNVYKGSQGPRSLCVRRLDHSGGWGMKLALACRTNQNANEGPVVNIGSSHSNTRCTMPTEPVSCSSDAGNRFKRVGFDNYGDSFRVYRSGARICARRTDHGGGWGMKLRLECPASGATYTWSTATLHIGSSHHNTKCILADYDFSCDSHAGNQGYRVNSHHANDRFNIYSSGDWMCTRRTDYHGGWGMDLKVHCQRYTQRFTVGEVHIGSSHSNKKCVMPTRQMTCYKYAGNKQYRLNSHSAGDSFNIFSSGAWMCARRTDYGGGWGMDLKFKCRRGSAISIKDVYIGSSSHNSKCVWTGVLRCESFSGDREYRMNSHSANDKFQIYNSGSYTCARRLDYGGGWGMGLKVRCQTR